MPLTKSTTWLMLVTNLPGSKQTLRMRIWRALKSAGGELLRDGVYVLPTSDSARQLFDEQRLEIKAAGGMAYVMTFQSESPDQQAELVKLFDRSSDYQSIQTRLNAFARAVGGRAESFQQLPEMAQRSWRLIFFPGNQQGNCGNSWRMRKITWMHSSRLTSLRRCIEKSCAGT